MSCYTYVLERLGIILYQEMYHFIQGQFSIQIPFIEPLTHMCFVYTLHRPHASSWGCEEMSIFLLDDVLPYVNGQTLGRGGTDAFQSPWHCVEKTSASRRRSVSHLCHLVVRAQSGIVKNVKIRVYAMTIGPLDKRGMFVVFPKPFFTSSPLSPLICSLVLKRERYNFF